MSEDVKRPRRIRSIAGDIEYKDLVIDEARKEITRLRDEVERLKGVIERLGSMEAFTLSRSATNHPADIELIARIDYAREALEAK